MSSGLSGAQPAKNHLQSSFPPKCTCPKYSNDLNLRNPQCLLSQTSVLLCSQQVRNGSHGVLQKDLIGTTLDGQTLPTWKLELEGFEMEDGLGCSASQRAKHHTNPRYFGMYPYEFSLLRGACQHIASIPAACQEDAVIALHQPKSATVGRIVF